MALSDTLDEARSMLADLKRNHKFKKANRERQEAAELQVALGRCRGKLTICSNDFKRTIRTQSHNVLEGKRGGYDTLIQEQMLWDAAMGYMMVQDAIFALKSISSYDSISHAYEMLDTAMRQIAGKGSRLPKDLIYNTKERNAYGYITSKNAMKDKEEKLSAIFEELIETGDIDACLAKSVNPALREAKLRGAYTGETPLNQESDLDDYARRLSSLGDDAQQDYSLDASLDSLMDIRPPEDD